MSGARLVWWALAGTTLLALGWAGFAPIHVARDKLFEIPQGTYARRMAGDQVDILPARIRLTVGLDDVLLLRNLDDVPQTFGPTIMMPGQSFRLPFEKPAEYQFECTAHTSGQMTVLVDPEPRWPWQKIRWRVHHWLENESQ
jgi:hypothetical protein